MAKTVDVKASVTAQRSSASKVSNIFVRIDWQHRILTIQDPIHNTQSREATENSQVQLKNQITGEIHSDETDLKSS